MTTPRSSDRAWPLPQEPGERSNGKRWSITPWRLFCGVLLGSALVHCLTLTISPPAWQDEIQILDYGRTLTPGGDRSFAVTWAPPGRPVELLTYTGCVLQNLAYRLCGSSMVGPRLSSLLGASLAAICLLGWLREAGVTPWIAAVAACTFLWDPVFVQGYRGARVDCWSIALMLAACWCVRRSARAANARAWLAAAGPLVALSGLTWPSAVLLLPLLVHEIVVGDLATASRDSTSREFLQRGWLLRLVIVGSSAAVCLLILLVPMWQQVRGMADDLSWFVSGAKTSRMTDLQARAWRLPASFIRSPLFPVAALAGAAIVGPRSWLVAFAAGAVGAVITQPYIHRAVYLLPYFALGFALAADRMRERLTGRRTALACLTLATMLPLVCNGAISLGARTAVALLERQRRNPALADRFVETLTAGRKGRVLLDSWSLYYPFRARGWAYWGPVDRRKNADIVRSLDYDLVIHDERDGTHALDRELLDRGYTKRVVAVEVPGGPAVTLVKDTPGFGPYVVYTRPDWPGGHDTAAGGTVAGGSAAAAGDAASAQP